DFELIFFNVQDAVVGYCPEKMDESNYFPAGGAGVGAGFMPILIPVSSGYMCCISVQHCLADF
ncbi:MAG: hypothetical protein ABFQ95_08335, partial [Pseudomonadota bacterium]